MKISLIVFDFDGTLVSSHETIYKSTIHALKEVGINVPIPENKFYEMIGWHFEDIFNVYGFSVPDFEEFIKIYKSIYFDYIDFSHLYNNVEKILASLKEKNILVSLLTTKGQDQAEILLNHFGISKYFDYIMGRRPGISHKPSPEPLLKICADLKINIENCMIVGDTEMDVECGKNANAITCAVSYGYRTKSVLQNLAPDFIIDNIFDLEQLVNGL